MTADSQQPYRILACLAHPDDEAFGMGGTLALLASEGCEVTLVCATLGEAGIVPEGYLKPGETVAELRKRELDCSVKTLGIHHLKLLGYRDSGMAGWDANNHPQALIAQPLEDVTERIIAVMREAKPDVVITFDPIGGYRHPDHIHTHQATVKAFEYLQQHEPGTGPKRLYFHLMPAGFLKAGILTLRLQGKDPRHYGDRGDIDLVDIANQGFPVHARVNYRKVADRQFNASRCHASQGGDSRGSGFQGFLVKLLSRPIDTFMQAYPQPNEGVLRHSLIEGLS